MLTLKESTLVLAKIRVHHGNAAITDLEARTFHEELRADMTLGEALEAVKRFYSDNSTGRWCGSGDVNAIVRRMRNESKPSEAQIARECEARGLSADEAWMYRRQRMLGNGPEQAQQQALTMLEGYAEGTLDFTPACSFQLLESQLYAMGTYANILQERARIEQVDLNAPLEGGESGEVPQD